MSKATSIDTLTRVRGIGKTTAGHLFEIGIKTVEELAQADPQVIIKEFNAKAGYKPFLDSVNGWILSARGDDWKYSKAAEKWYQIKNRAEKKSEEFEIDFESFKVFYGKDDIDRNCRYCEISEADIGKLIEQKKIVTKRLETRGKSMEIDRRNPQKGYIYKKTDNNNTNNDNEANNNIGICCYWCNNAKTDEFTEEEFAPIGAAIREIWKKRKEN